MKKIFKILLSPFVIPVMIIVLAYAFMSFPFCFAMIVLSEENLPRIIFYGLLPGAIFWCMILVYAFLKQGYEIIEELF